DETVKPGQSIKPNETKKPNEIKDPKPGKLEDGKKLPNTATNTYNLFLIGGLLLLLGIGLFIFHRRKDLN
ncbi:LPXTG cell wall anchor domain-containing protein, partial [Lederbergia lenta]